MVNRAERKPQALCKKDGGRRAPFDARKVDRQALADLLADYCCTLDEFDMGGIAQGVAAAAQYSLPLCSVNSSCLFRTTARYSF